MSESRQYSVKGRVQGVGYRFFATRHATDAGLKGWICNENDGSVLIRVEGPNILLDRFEEALWKGPQGARVESITRMDLPFKENFKRFEIVDP